MNTTLQWIAALALMAVGMALILLPIGVLITGIEAGEPVGALLAALVLGYAAYRFLLWSDDWSHRH